MEQAFGALFPQLPRGLRFFPELSPVPPPACNLINDMLPVWQERLAELLQCAGFGRRQKAETFFRQYPALLTCRGTLTDITQKPYEDITAFEYAVKVKDSYFVKKVVEFLETYQGKDKYEIAADLLKQFDRHFSEERLASVNGFIEASNAWRDAYPERSWDKRNYHFVRDIGGAQAHFEAHILQRYCNLTPFTPLPKFDEPDLPESLWFYNWSGGRTDSLLITSPGSTGNFALLRRGGRAAGSAGRSAGVAWTCRLLDIDCAAVDALDKARTTDLLALRARLVSILAPMDSIEAHAPTPGYSFADPS